MGINMFNRGRKSSSCCTTKPSPVDPIPSLFKIEVLEQYDNCVLGVVNYPNCTTFDGDKVIVWINTTVSEVEGMILIDPHFLLNNKIIARFKPTVEGFKLARKFALIV